MDRLIHGVRDFQARQFGHHEELFAQLAQGQQPHALFITCSDSRIHPNLLTQTQPGELFIMRNAGNIVPPYEAAAASGEAATIEFAVVALGIRDIIVCGHTLCGAMSGLMSGDPLDSLPSVTAWLSHAQDVRNATQEKHAGLTGNELVTAAVKQNVLAQLGHLRTHPAVAKALSSGSVTLHGWVYRIETGDVFELDPQTGRYASIGLKPGEL